MMSLSNLEPKAAYWINALALEPHPEGGFFKRTLESELTIEIRQGVYRKSFSAIYYLLQKNDITAFHKLKSDEIWHFYAGGPMELFIIKPDGDLERIILGNDIRNNEKLQVLVKRDQ